MARVAWHPLAVADLDGIWDFIAQDNLSAADRIVERLYEATILLSTQPAMGQLRLELAPELRSFVVANYVLFYRARQDNIEIARILHAARDIDAIF